MKHLVHLISVLDLSDVTGMMTEVRAGSPVSDCTEDSGIGTESLSPKHPNISTPVLKNIKKFKKSSKNHITFFTQIS